MSARIALAWLTLACALPAQAGVMFHAGRQQEREAETGLAASGHGVGMSIDLGACCFFGVNYSSLRTDPFTDASGIDGRLDYRSGDALLGAVWPWTERLGLTATGGYAEMRTRGLDGFSADPVERLDGPAGSLMLWYQPASRLAFTAARGYSYVGVAPGWDSSVGVGLRLWRELWLDSGYWRGEGAQGWSVGLRTTLADE